jgi:hypothetical protein
MHKIDETHKTYVCNNSFKFQLPKYIAIVLFPKNPIYICCYYQIQLLLLGEGATFEEWFFFAFLVNGMMEVLIHFLKGVLNFALVI